MSGLPEIARGSWNKAAIIAGLNDVGTHPTDTRSRSVISLSGPNLYTVVGNRCTCKNFKAQNLCAHSIAAAHSRGELVQFVIGYIAPTVDPLVQPPPLSGKKPGASNRKRIPTTIYIKKFLYT